MKLRTRSVAGFTLIELVIVVAIIAILAAIVLPMYQRYVVKARRVAAAGCMLESAQFMERYRSINMTYLNGAAAPALPACSTDVTRFYAVGFDGTPTASAFALQAVPQGVQASKDTLCGTLGVDQSGARTESGSASNASECF